MFGEFKFQPFDILPYPVISATMQRSVKAQLDRQIFLNNGSQHTVYRCTILSLHFDTCQKKTTREKLFYHNSSNSQKIKSLY